MKKQIILLVALLLLLGTPLAQADNVTVHGTTGMLEAHLVDQHTLEQVGTVEVWNTAMDINIIVRPFSERCVMSKVSVYLDTVPVQPPVPEAYPELVSDYGALLEDCQDLADLADPPPEWLEEYQQYLAESQSDENVDESFEDLLKAYTALVGKVQGIGEFLGFGCES
jgi:hypothetical protein